MRRPTALTIGVVIGLATLMLSAWPGPAAAGEIAARWAAASGPAAGPARVIGTYSHGCFSGGQALPAEGPNHQVVRLSRARYYGHPELIDMLQGFLDRAAAAGIGPINIADLSQPRGGPMTYGHASHETGLDADIWFRLDLPILPRARREALDDIELVDRRWWRPAPGWEDRHARMVALAAEDPRVERIFVHPVIKRDLCDRAWAERSWLGKVRPWWNHAGHMHVRIGCPAGSPDCTAQRPPPIGEGCGAELMSWFPERLPVPPPAPVTPARRAQPDLPAACAAILPPAAAAATSTVSWTHPPLPPRRPRS